MRITQNRAAARRPRPIALLAVALLALAVAPATATALTIDFEGLQHGEVVTSFGGVTITADNFNRSFDYAVAFDSTETGTRDPDLEDDWAGGNLVGEVLGNLLILQENDYGCDTGVCRKPDDEGRRAAGTLTLEFDVATPFLGFDLIDVDSTMAENGVLTLWDAAGASASIDFDVILSGYDIGDNTANRIDPLLAEAFDLGDIVKAEFLMGGSGAIDNIEIIPEPTTALLLGLGLVGLGISGRRRA